jgi:hypothetical protein
MTDTLEHEIRLALAEKAAAFPPGAHERLEQIDYGSKSGHLPRPRRFWSFASATGAGLTGVVVATVLLLSSGGSSLVPLAYAGWSATPQTPSPLEVSKAVGTCKRSAGPLAHSVLIAVSGRLILAERRGKYLAVLYAKGRSSAVCISDDGRFGGAAGSSGRWRAAPGPEQLGYPSGAGGSAQDFPGSDGGEYEAWGRAGRDVLGVTFIFAGRRTVETTVAHGWYFAWWPNVNWPVRVEVRMRKRTVVSPMPGQRCRDHPSSCVFQLKAP